jgi:hypothetical protein
MGQPFSSILFAPPSVAEGLARILDLGDTLTEYNRSLSPEQADAYALTADWNAVVDDLVRAFKKAEGEIGKPKQLELAW